MANEHILPILYEMALVIGSEVRLKPLLTKTLQRLLYHTSFPAGFVCLEVPPQADLSGMMEARIESAVGDYELVNLVGHTLPLPIELLCGPAERTENADLLAALPGTFQHYKAFLRLPIDKCGVIVLLAPQMPDTDLPLTQLFQPVMANLVQAILLCRHNEAYTDGLVAERNGAKTALRQSEALFHNLARISPVGIFRTNAKGECLYVNERWCSIAGLTPEEARSQGWARGLHPEDREQVTQAWYEATNENRPFKAEYRFQRLDGTITWVLGESSSEVDDNGNITGYVGTITDITDHKRMEEQQRLATNVFESSYSGVMITDTEARVISVNRAFTRITGYAPDEIIGQNPRLLSSGRHDRDFYREMWRDLLASGYWQGEIWNRRKSADVYPEWLSVSVVRDNNGKATHYVGIFSDISERKAAEERIEFLAHHDPLTGLPNRILFRDRFERVLAHAAREQSKAALLFLDLDNFKNINDSLGHPVGDRLLQVVAERLKTCVRDIDTVSRMGGDEFLILLTDVRDIDAVAVIAHKIIGHLSQAVEVDNHSLSTSVSIGISLYPNDGSDFDTLLKQADTALYHAKESGRNTCQFFTEAMNVSVLERMELEGRLRRALDKGEFLLHYQPQLDLATGRIVGIEALIRWNSPELGMVPPARFISIAEESGLIVPIGVWVLREACRQAVAWRAKGLSELVVAVNLSAIQFKRGDLVSAVADTLCESGLDPHCLELELTESILIQDTKHTLEKVHALKALGIKLSIDDFGTGYSSLAYLKRFAVDKIKIDQSFVRNVGKYADDDAIVRAVIQMAQSLKLRTIAEGVEESDQVNILRGFGCDEVQGYYFSHPLPADELFEFLRRNSS